MSEAGPRRQGVRLDGFNDSGAAVKSDRSLTIIRVDILSNGINLQSSDDQFNHERGKRWPNRLSPFFTQMFSSWLNNHQMELLSRRRNLRLFGLRCFSTDEFVHGGRTCRNGLLNCSTLSPASLILVRGCRKQRRREQEKKRACLTGLRTSRTHLERSTQRLGQNVLNFDQRRPRYQRKHLQH